MSDILSLSKKYVEQLLTDKLSDNIVYHNLKHTQRVVKSTSQILGSLKLTAQENQNILIAAWFHDSGYTQGCKDHEEKSCVIATSFLTEQQYPKEDIGLICSYIMATKMSHVPISLPEKIIRDADSSHFGHKTYIETSNFLKKELSRLGTVNYSAKEWRNENIKMFSKKHQFHTDYAKDNWQKGKENNLKRLKKGKKEEKDFVKKEKLKMKFKEESPERTAQTMYRVALRNHLSLSSIADTKANILLSVNAIIISLALSNLIPKLDNPSNHYLVIPTALFVLFSLTSMILSILATRPNITSGAFTQKDVEDKKVNLLFFGNFHKMNLDDYENAMNIMIKDKDYLNNALTKDLFFLGKVLNRKYKILRTTYTIFMIGIILSVVAFGIAYQMFGVDRV